MTESNNTEKENKINKYIEKLSQYSEKNNDNKKINEINKNEDYDNYEKLSDKEKLIKRTYLLRKLEHLQYHHGVHLTKNYNVDSDYFDMKREYILHVTVMESERKLLQEKHEMKCALEFIYHASLYLASKYKDEDEC
jgi:hypothetical protein